MRGSELLLLALPGSWLTDVHVTQDDELVAEIELPRYLQVCVRCGVIDLHRYDSGATRRSDFSRSPAAPADSAGRKWLLVSLPHFANSLRRLRDLAHEIETLALDAVRTAEGWRIIG